MAKSKKKKKPAGAKKPAYAKGKPPGQKSKSTAAAKSAVSKGGGAKGASKKSGAAEDRPQQWNVIKQGSPEMKLFLLLMAVIAVMTILQFPAWQDVSNEKYEIDKKEYPKLVEKWEKQYPEEKEQEENKNSKPVKPTEPNIQVFLIQSLNGILMLAMVSFLGINIQRRTDLNVPILDGVIEGNFDMSRLGDLGLNSLIYSIASIVPMIVMILITRAVVVPGEFSTAAIASWKLCLLMIYTAFNLQLTLLFLLMSTMVWLFHKYRNKLKLEPHWAAIVVTVVLSGFYVLPFNIAPGVKLIYSIASSLLISFSLVGILGYLYWKKGLEYSLVAGIISYGVMPLLASVII